MSDADNIVPFEGWAIVELMGHRRLAGFVKEEPRFGSTMLRIDVPDEGGECVATQFYGAAAIYCVTATTEEIARKVASSNRPAPVHIWELPAPIPPRGRITDEEYPDDEF